MDWNVFLIIVAAGMILLALTAWMLHRSWGDFPRQLNVHQFEPPAKRAPSWANQTNDDDDDDDDDDDEWAERSLPAGAPDDGMILVTHPGVRNAITQAIERGGSPYASYFVRDGDQIYLAAYRISDPDQRAQVTQLFQSINNGEIGGLSIYDLLQVLRRFGRP
jgi:hypothetical protein